MKIKLSVCIPAYNEEKNLKYSLGSVYDLADEVIIINPGSTDRTAEVAQSYGKKVKIFNTDNPPNFLVNKQRAIEKAKGEWILQLDADEQLTPALKEEIRNIVFGKDKQLKKYVGFWMARKNFFLIKFLEKGGVYPDYVLRLYRRKKGRFQLKDIHENVKVEGLVGYLKNDLLHYSDLDFSRYLLRWDRYTSFDAKQAIQEGKKLSFLNYFFWKPLKTFFLMFFRHKGFMDGFPGFVFALFSAIRFWVIYIKWWQKWRNNIKHKT